MQQSPATTPPTERKSRTTRGHRQEPPSLHFACGCRTDGQALIGSYCTEAVRLWDKVAVANHNLTVTTQVVKAGWWTLTTFRTFGPTRVKLREAIYAWRRGQYDAHFKTVPA